MCMSQAAWYHVVRVRPCERHQQDMTDDCEERYTVTNTVRRAQAESSSEKHKACMWRCAHLTVISESMSVSNETGECSAARPITQSQTCRVDRGEMKG